MITRIQIEPIVDKADEIGEKFPQFIFAREMGKRSFDEISTDLMLITMLAGMEVPKDLRARNNSAGELIRTTIKTRGFEGKRGERLLIETDLPTIDARTGRRIMVAGLGRRDQFCARAAYTVFESLFEEAIRSKVRRVTVPFTSNRGTGSCLTMKGMAHQMNLALHACYERLHGEPVALKEVQIYCTAQASAYIKQGLEIAEPMEFCC